ncbi:MAG: SMP-30/gluconolactonase/LRE family protein [Pirellulales bacterium]|nr:SMP-30/gluconolactonase/LRE family protein [Pirellulales bacterium]
MSRMLIFLATLRWPATALVALILTVLTVMPAARADEATLLASGLENPESAVVGGDGRIYVTIIGKSNADGDGRVGVLEGNEIKTFAEGLNDPKGIARRGNDLVVADKTKVWLVGPQGEVSVLAEADQFPVKPRFFNDIEVGPDGEVYVSDTGAFTSQSAVFRIAPAGEITVVADTKTLPELKGANGVLLDGKEHLLVADITAGKLYRVELATGKGVEIASDLGGADGLAWDAKGRLYISDWRGGRVFRRDTAEAEPQLFTEGYKAAADIAFDPAGRLLLPDMRAGTLTAIPISD